MNLKSTFELPLPPTNNYEKCTVKCNHDLRMGVLTRDLLELDGPYIPVWQKLMRDAREAAERLDG